MVKSGIVIASRQLGRIAARWSFLVACLLPAPLIGQASNLSAADLSRTHALLINGGGSKRINYQSHLLHVQRIQKILSEAGVPADNISILSSDGTDPGADLATRSVQENVDFRLLAGTRLEKILRPRIQYENSLVEGVQLQAATLDDLEQWFEKAGSELGPGDTLLLYVTDHGTLNEEDPSNNQIVLWGKGESIDVETLKSLLRGLDPSVKVVALMSQCFSGSFANLMFGQADEDVPPRKMGGYFSSTETRPAYGCYPENRELYQVGHSFRFFDAIEAGDGFQEAHASVLLSDRTPDVPLKSSDVYLQKILGAESERLGLEFDEFVDQQLRSAWKDKKTWEKEIRLLDAIGESFGYFSPRFLSELAQHSDSLWSFGEQLDEYELAWNRALRSLNRANLDRFVEQHPEWGQRLNEDELKALAADERAELTRQLLVDLAAYTGNDPETAGRLQLLQEKADLTRNASYRVQVREAAMLRMRFLLIGIAGRQYLSESGSDSERALFGNMTEAEAFSLSNEARPQSSRAVVEAYPRFDEELELVSSSLPGWMGIQFRQVTPERRGKLHLEDGAVSVRAVYPDSPAHKSGLEVGDIIVGPPDSPFKERDLVREWVMTAPIGEAQSLQVRRGEEMLTLSLTPEPYPREWPSLPGPPKVGSAAPELGEIERFRGNPPEMLFDQGPYLLFFWATWCGPCKAALPELLDFERERGIPVISITDESAESVERFLQERKGPFPESIVLDEYRRSFVTYGVSGTPSFVLVDAQGKIESISTGYRRSKGLSIDDWVWKGQEESGGSNKQ